MRLLSRPQLDSALLCDKRHVICFAFGSMSSVVLTRPWTKLNGSDVKHKVIVGMDLSGNPASEHA